MKKKCKLFFPKRWQSGCIKVNRVDMCRCVWVWVGMWVHARRRRGRGGVGPGPGRISKNIRRSYNLGSGQRPFTLWKCIIRRFSNSKWAETAQSAAFARVSYWKSDHWPTFKKRMRRRQSGRRCDFIYTRISRGPGSDFIYTKNFLRGRDRILSTQRIPRGREPILSPQRIS